MYNTGLYANKCPTYTLFHFVEHETWRSEEKQIPGILMVHFILVWKQAETYMNSLCWYLPTCDYSFVICSICYTCASKDTHFQFSRKLQEMVIAQYSIHNETMKNILIYIILTCIWHFRLIADNVKIKRKKQFCEIALIFFLLFLHLVSCCQFRTNLDWLNNHENALLYPFSQKDCCN